MISTLPTSYLHFVWLSTSKHSLFHSQVVTQIFRHLSCPSDFVHGISLCLKCCCPVVYPESFRTQLKFLSSLKLSLTFALVHTANTVLSILHTFVYFTILLFFKILWATSNRKSWFSWFKQCEKLIISHNKKVVSRVIREFVIAAAHWFCHKPNFFASFCSVNLGVLTCPQSSSYYGYKKTAIVDVTSIFGTMQQKKKRADPFPARKVVSKPRSSVNVLYHLLELGHMSSWTNHLIRWQLGELTYPISLEYSEFIPKQIIFPEGFDIWGGSDSLFRCEGRIDLV